MVRKMVTRLVICGLILATTRVFAADKPLDPAWTRCNSTDDCVILGAGPCDKMASVNKAHLQVYLNRLNANTKANQCPPSQPYSHAVCQHHRCTVIYEGGTGF